jgi:hypothetical protein
MDNFHANPFQQGLKAYESLVFSKQKFIHYEKKTTQKEFKPYLSYKKILPTIKTL